jgi:hypothetical protein
MCALIQVKQGVSALSEVNSLVGHYCARETQLNVDQDASEGRSLAPEPPESAEMSDGFREAESAASASDLAARRLVSVNLREPRVRQSLREEYGRPYIETAAAIFANRSVHDTR